MVLSVFIGNAIVVGAHFKPFFWFEDLKFVCIFVQLRARYSFNPGLDLVRRKIVIHIIHPKGGPFCRYSRSESGSRLC